MSALCDVLCIGAGPAGLSAALNCAAEGLSVTLFERGIPGGQMRFSTRLENVAGTNGPVTGQQLTDRLLRQAKGFGARIIADEVSAVSATGPTRSAQLLSGKTFTCRVVIVAAGLKPRTLTPDPIFGVFPAMQESEMSKYSGQSVAVVGSGNSAGQAAEYFERIGARTTLITRKPLADTMSHYLLGRMAGINVIESTADQSVHRSDGKPCILGSCYDAIVAYVGSRPERAFTLDTDDDGYIKTDSALCCGIPGVFAIGDIRAGSVKRVSAALGDGASVASRVFEYFRQTGA